MIQIEVLTQAMVNVVAMKTMVMDILWDKIQEIQTDFPVHWAALGLLMQRESIAETLVNKVSMTVNHKLKELSCGIPSNFSL